MRLGFRGTEVHLGHDGSVAFSLCATCDLPLPPPVHSRQLGSNGSSICARDFHWFIRLGRPSRGGTGWRALSKTHLGCSGCLRAAAPRSAAHQAARRKPYALGRLS